MKEKIYELLSGEFADVDFNYEGDLVDDEILDSFKVTQIVFMLSKEFSVTIPFEEIRNENLNSIEAMAAMVERLKNASA